MCESPDQSELYTTKDDLRSRIERFIMYMYSLHDKKLNSDSLRDKKLNSADIIELQLRSNKAESLYKQYEDILTQIRGRTQWNKCDHHFEAQFYKALAISKDLVNKHNNNHTKSTTSSDKNINSNPFQFPAIQLPKFNGCSDKWLDFRETFTALIHSNNLIDDMEKFCYLRASLEDSAAVLIQSVDSYIAAWKLLNETYNNLNKLVQRHLSSLFNIEVIPKSSSIALKGFIDHLLKNLRALELLGQPVKQWDPLLLHILSPKLDQNTRREWEKYSSKEDSRMTADAFIQFLQIHADFMEARELDDQESCPHDERTTEYKDIPASLQLATSTTSSQTISTQEPTPTERGKFTEKFLRLFKQGIPLGGKYEYNAKKRMIISLEMLLISEKDFVDFLNGLPHTSSQTEVLKAVLKHVGRFTTIANYYKI